ncbi:hypothetical protein QYY77_20145 [Xanthomonas campestris pv. campestris]|uniref:hypothetical protein n=1 Tax=Xanthomonas campestris TaxID=339 RepID=UPI001EE8BBF0|nr:hypothetical protein [Xanthomonas campestris]MEA0738346.1 hypothetical protein [Xanthomonas campestris pv. campestris]
MEAPVRSNASTFLAHTVEPTVAEFEKAPYDIRRGRLAAIVLYHMADHFALDGFASCERKLMDQEIANVRARVQAACPDFTIIRDVADASKHAKLASSKNVPRQLSSAKQLSATPGLFLAPFGYGRFAEAGEVIVTLDDGTTLSLLPAVRTVLATWSSMF